MLVAARRDMIERVLDATRRAGLRAHGIDLSAFAMIRALHDQGRDEATTLYMSVGGVTNLAVATAKTCVFTRVVPHGTEAIAGELAERRGLTLEHAHGWLKHVGLLTPIDDIEGEAEIVVEARNVLSDGVRRIADDVRNSIDFHAMQDGARRGPAGGSDRSSSGDPGLLRSAGRAPRRAGRGGLGVGRPGGWVRRRRRRIRLAVAAGLTVEERSA